MKIVLRIFLSSVFLTFVFSLFLVGCGTVKKPLDAFVDAANLIGNMEKLRSKINSFRIAGSVDHFGEEHRIRGGIFLFAKLPDNLRIDLLSPFGSTLSVLTVANNNFQMSDLRESIYLEGAAEPCNIARFIHIPLAPQEVTGILIGKTPIIKGKEKIVWNKQGYYEITIKYQNLVQVLEIDPDKTILSLRRSRLSDENGNIFDISYDRWRLIKNEIYVPHEIRVKMPREKTNLLIAYDNDAVEVNIKLPQDAWIQSFPKGANVQSVVCN